MSLTLARLGIVAGSFPIAAGGDFEPIATVTVGSGGANVVDITSIPSTYKHLQVRIIARSDVEDALYTSISCRPNLASGSGGDSNHSVVGNGSTVSATGATGSSSLNVGYIPRNQVTANVFGAAIIDILDYADTSKNKVVRTIAGTDANGGGQIHLMSAARYNTTAITSLRFLLSHGNFIQHSTVALYGVKAP